MKLSFLCWFFASANFVHATFAITEKDVVLLTQGSRGLIVVGQPYYVDPIPEFMTKNGIDENEFSKSVFAFVQEKLLVEKADVASRSLMLLTRLSDTNTVPWLSNYVSDPSNTSILEDILYLYAIRGDRDCFNIVKKRIEENTMPFEARKSFYSACIDRVANDVHEIRNYNEYFNFCWYPFLREMLEQEEEFSLRIAIDDIFASQLKGWRYSEERKNVYMSWINEDISPQERELALFRIREINEAISAGDADDHVLCEIKPRVLTPEEIEKQLLELSNSVQKVDSPAMSIQGGSPSMGEIKERGNCRFTCPLAVSAIAITLLGVAGFLLWQRRCKK